MAKRVGSQSDQPFIKLYRELTYRWTPWEVWQDFVTWFTPMYFSGMWSARRLWLLFD